VVTWFPDKFQADLDRVARVAEVDNLQVCGFTLMVHLSDGGVRLITNGCCAAHAVRAFTEMTSGTVPPLVPCPGNL
jgi:hypothetical protein